MCIGLTVFQRKREEKYFDDLSEFNEINIITGGCHISDFLTAG